MNGLLAEFLEHERTKGRRDQCLRDFRKRVPRLFRYLEERGLRFCEVKVKDALSFQGMLLESKTKTGRKYSPHTVLSIVFAAASFYDFLKEKGMVYSNPFREIKKTRSVKKLPANILKEKEMNRLLERLSCFEEGKTLKHRVFRYRVHVIAELLYSTGLRISEAASLKVGDVDLRRSLVEVRDGKCGIPRAVFLTGYAREVLRVYLESMRPLVANEWNERHGELLFGTGWSWLGHVVNRIVKEAALEAEVPVPTSHGFRHALGYHLLRAGCNIRYIQEILGHKRLKNTEVYTKVEKEDLKAVMDRHHPRRFGRISLETSGHG